MPFIKLCILLYKNKSPSVSARNSRGMRHLSTLDSIVSKLIPLTNKSISLCHCLKNKTLNDFSLRVLMKDGTFLLSQFVSKLVPSTIKSLTSVFGMGTGGPLLHQHRHGITASLSTWNYQNWLFCAFAH